MRGRKHYSVKSPDETYRCQRCPFRTDRVMVATVHAVAHDRDLVRLPR